MGIIFELEYSLSFIVLTLGDAWEHCERTDQSSGHVHTTSTEKTFVDASRDSCKPIMTPWAVKTMQDRRCRYLSSILTESLISPLPASL